VSETRPMSAEVPTKAAVSVTEMAHMVGLSRARFYQLLEAGVFPQPGRDAETGRPFFNEELQKACLEVRRRNCGVNGKPVLFYARRAPLTPAPARPRKATPRPPTDEYADLTDALRALGLVSVTAAQAGAAVGEVFPRGTAGVDEAEVVRAVFLRLRRRDSGGKVGK
jgi:hypothetical protein